MMVKLQKELQIVKRMNNGDRVSTVVYGNDVAIAVKPRNTVTNETAMANEIRQSGFK